MKDVEVEVSDFELLNRRSKVRVSGIPCFSLDLGFRNVCAFKYTSRWHVRFSFSTSHAGAMEGGIDFDAGTLQERMDTALTCASKYGMIFRSQSSLRCTLTRQMRVVGIRDLWINTRTSVQVRYR